MPLAPTAKNYLLVLTSKLTDYDQKEIARERRRGGLGNHNRLNLLFEAANRVRDDLAGIGEEDGSPEAIARLRQSLQRRFDPEFPPIRSLIKLIDSRPAQLRYGPSQRPARKGGAARKKTPAELEREVQTYLAETE